MKYKDKFLATYEREIENKPVNNISFYGGIALTIILIIFFFGIKPTITAIGQNIAYKRQLNEIKTNMETKLEQIDLGEENMNRISTEIELLNTAIPNKSELEQFLSELVLVAARSGFVLDRVKKNEEFEKEIPVHLELRGQLDQLPKLTDEIEKMERFVKIINIRTQQEEYDAIIRMKINIYML